MTTPIAISVYVQCTYGVIQVWDEEEKEGKEHYTKFVHGKAINVLCIHNNSRHGVMMAEPYVYILHFLRFF